MNAPPARRRFLTARWHNLILANFAIPERLLAPRLPPGLELDFFEGKCWASLVGFQFLDTRVLGVSWPGYRNFPEWNLRFYVRRGDQRGVCFIREFVPKRLICWVARTIYNEPYSSAPITESVRAEADRLAVEYTLDWGGKAHRMRAVGALPSTLPGVGSAERWFIDQSWGFGVSRRGRTLCYEVNHPNWDIYPVTDFTSDVDWVTLYGPEWAGMNGAKPASVVLALGSEVSVYPKG